MVQASLMMIIIYDCHIFIVQATLVLPKTIPNAVVDATHNNCYQNYHIEI
jgi:hypothetical protein